ncbi:NADH:flavin oxidoreductase [Aestuariicella hydrocarbonica]|uniref:NADH:flavin oxidoreductase n=1 Tax=Pseudomaricurvus hydrocarbonicus TaxID=1470433 RepID=A0A9E5MHM1_9GAMM|nr:NADH:flavin oxidoreductase [Aestuariicella hydrocarbonica]NHO66111.1 NADH:flavin oxidoreductase [Aestuariicella hydrocarbonica]
MSDALRRALSPATLGKLPLRNRLIKAGTYEGKSPGGVPSQLLQNFHVELGEGGIGMTTVAYCATEADGRIHDQMMYMHEGIRPQLQDLVSAVKATGARVAGQVVHCGYFSRNPKLQRLDKPLGPSRQLNTLGVPLGRPFAGAMTHADIDYFVQSFHDAALFMKEVGFDALEVHCGHGYGISQFISPKTNRRTDDYGGSLHNRMRVPVRIIETIRAAVGDDFPIIAKMGLTDGIKGGLEENEAVEVARYLDQAGCDALITTGGTSSFNPNLMFRGPSIHHGLIEQSQSLIAKLGMKILGPSLFKEYPYHELYFRDGCRRVRDAVDCQLVYIGGCSTLESLEQVMRDGIDFVQLGRTLLADPNYPRNASAALANSQPYDSGCNHCNRCVALIDAPGGIYCPELHPDKRPVLNT